jgi:hypothetical protein
MSLYQAGKFGQTCGHAHYSIQSAYVCSKKLKYTWVEQVITPFLTKQVRKEK